MTIFYLFSGQSQVPSYFVEGALWLYHTWESWEPGQENKLDILQQYTITGDTLINTILYKKLLRISKTTREIVLTGQLITTYDSRILGYLRYDLAKKKVYYFDKDKLDETIIYNFNLHIGDTLPMQNRNWPITTVEKIDSVILFGSAVKRFILKKPFGSAISPEPNYILEGFGGSNGLVDYNPFLQVVSGGIFMTELCCFQLAEKIYPNDPCPELNFISSTNNGIEKENIIFAPQPSFGEVTIKMSEQLIQGEIFIYNNLAQLIYTSKINNLEFAITLQKKGYFYWIIKDKSGKMIKGKIENL